MQRHMALHDRMGSDGHAGPHVRNSRCNIPHNVSCNLELPVTGRRLTLSRILLYFLVFVCKPLSARAVLPHDFISNNEITTDGKPIDGISRWLADFTRSVVPRNCHSHNDYWRPYPLFSALAAGCMSVEADIWLSDNGLDLLVGHDRGSLSSERTLQKMYLDPLLTILEHQNRQGSFTPFEQARGIFNTRPDMALVLLIDVKTNPTDTWPLLVKQLDPLRKRQFLTRFEQMETSPGVVTKQGIWPGPITVVGTGLLDRATFFDHNHRSYADYETYHDTFIDAPLSTLAQDNNFWRLPDPLSAPLSQLASNSGQLWSADDAYYASASFKTTIGSVRTGFTEEQRNKVRAHVQVARQSGLRSRYWDIPDWPIGYRDYIWKILIEENVDMLNVDDLESAARWGWTQGYLRDVLWMSLVSTYLLSCTVFVLFLFRRLLKRQCRC
ncbi:Putative PLC-like phosphodiesterase, TIM beta/alpha-barrel domain superfamily [Colletotrichum destructivum]|uniref:Altered inheritance of mitochondria protein 6 n=1 Tax=Colletotrichum destructivum TaxID=34406 RepID=A0AAX4IGR4_9PEZI|nr:Putative PLC-like phosphodiesterase, TIM beta/alpha-barrel domain superfamily [Colletotrichum destructivum]